MCHMDPQGNEANRMLKACRDILMVRYRLMFLVKFIVSGQQPYKKRGVSTGRKVECVTLIPGEIKGIVG